MIPSEWRKSVIVPIPKKRSRGVCKTDDYWGISTEGGKAVGGGGARRFQEGKRVQRPANDIGIAGADEGSDRKGDVCQFHRLQESI